MKEKQLVVEIVLAVAFILALTGFVQAAVQMLQLLVDINMGSIMPISARVSTQYILYAGPMFTVAVGLFLISVVLALFTAYFMKENRSKAAFILLQAVISAGLLLFMFISKMFMDTSADGLTGEMMDLTYANTIQQHCGHLFAVALLLSIMTTIKTVINSKNNSVTTEEI